MKDLYEDSVNSAAFRISSSIDNYTKAIREAIRENNDILDKNYQRELSNDVSRKWTMVVDRFMEVSTMAAANDSVIDYSKMNSNDLLPCSYDEFNQIRENIRKNAFDYLRSNAYAVDVPEDGEARDFLEALNSFESNVESYYDSLKLTMPTFYLKYARFIFPEYKIDPVRFLKVDDSYIIATIKQYFADMSLSGKSSLTDVFENGVFYFDEDDQPESFDITSDSFLTSYMAYLDEVYLKYSLLLGNGQNRSCLTDVQTVGNSRSRI